MGYVVAVFMLVIGLGGLSASFLLFHRLRRAGSYVPVPGRIIERSIVGVLGGGGPPASFGPKVKYAYTVDGREFVNDRYAFFQRGYRLDKAKEALAKIPDDITVYCNPRNPSEAVVDRSGKGFAIISCCAGAIIMLIGLLVLGMTISPVGG